MKYIAKDLEDVAKMIERLAENEERFAKVATIGKQTKALAEAKAAGYREAAAIVRDVEIRP